MMVVCWLAGGICVLLTLVYALVMLRYRWQWQGLAKPHPRPLPRREGCVLTLLTSGTPPHGGGTGGGVAPVLRLSVLIAARNEAPTLPHLLADLRAQTLLTESSAFEVIVIDDHSTDATAEVVLGAIRDSPFPLQLLQLAHLPHCPTGKKAAIEAALAAAAAPWVVCTDADCRVPPGWLAAYAAATAEPAAQFISGPVLLTGRGLLAALQGLELAALVGVGGASIGAGAPTMCNGANLAYRRSAFAAVGGFGGNAHVPSGDDEFLLHKIAAAYPNSIRFLKSPAAVVRTAAQPTLAALLAQRVRWASKWQHYRNGASRRLALLVLGANVALAALPLLALRDARLWPWVAAGWVFKVGADVLLGLPVLGFFGRRRWLALLPLLQLLYAPYGLAVGLAGLRGGYRWKGRRVRR